MTIALAEKPATAPSLTPALRLVSDALSRVDALILSRVESEIPLIKDVTRHIVASGGKRLRPLLTLLCAEMFGYQGERHVALAAAVEFIHTATLLHDDVVDESALRRGLATANDVFGNKVSVLVGDFLFSQSFRLMVADGSLEVLDILSDAAAIITQGEVKQLTTEGDPTTTESKYLDVIACKTAVLFAAACEIGPIVAGATPYRTALKAYGHALGMAFQLVDDALDYSANQAQLGKTVGDDFREGKVTLPVIMAYRAGTEAEREFWQRTLTERDQREGDFEEACRLLNAYATLSATLSRARFFCEQAREALRKLPESAHKSALSEIVDFCVARTH